MASKMSWLRLELELRYNNCLGKRNTFDGLTSCRGWSGMRVAYFLTCNCSLKIPPENLDSLKSHALLLAQCWEGLSRLRDGLDGTSGLINAAIAYQFAGYEANAACIARRIVNSEVDGLPTLTETLSLFLQRLFVRISNSRSWSEQPVADPAHYGQLVLRTINSVAAKGIDSAAGYFLSGDEEAFSDSRRLLSKAAEAFAEIGKAADAVNCRMMHAVLPVMKERSTWHLLQQLLDSDPRWDRYLKLLSRGLGRSLLDSVSISELWPSQSNALRAGLLKKSAAHFIRMPTSAGKTRVAEIAIVFNLLTKVGSRCVYIAPYRALAGELEESFLNLFADLGISVSTLLGSYDVDELQEALITTAELLIVTPEKLDLITRVHPEWLNNVSLFVWDEWQVIGDQDRGAKIELLIARLRHRLKDSQFMFLSAVVSDSTLNAVCKWFNQDPTSALKETWRPSVQRVAKFQWRGTKGSLEYHSQDDLLRLPAAEFIYGIIESRRWRYVNEATGRMNTRKFPEPDSRAQTAAELALRFVDVGPVLVFCSQRNWVTSVCKALYDRLELEKRSGSDALPIGQPVGSSAIPIAAEWLGDDHPITQYLRAGIALHHGNLPEALRKAVETDYRERRFKVLVATNTLAQGVNLPIRTVIVHSCWRVYDENTMERVSARDYWNIAGRAGRAREETEGLIVHLINDAKDERDFQFYLERRYNPEEVKGGLEGLVESLIQDRLSEAAIVDGLTPDVLAMVVEEGAAIDDVRLRSYVTESYSAYTGTMDSDRQEVLFHILKESRDAVMVGAGSPELRTLYNSTGLSISSCVELRRRILDRMDSLNSLLSDESDTNVVGNLTATVLEDCSGIQETRPRYAYAGNHLDLLQGWVEGESVSALAKRVGADPRANEELGRFIEDFFGYKIPWAASAYIRIARNELGLDAIGNAVRFLPAMIRYGVNVPEASWLMSIGLGSRTLSLQMAADYRRQAKSGSTYADFLAWVRGLDPELLRQRYKIEGPILRETSKVISRTGANPWLTAGRSVREALPLETEVAGVRYGSRRLVANTAASGAIVALHRDYANLLDRNAIQVFFDGKEIGYVPALLAQFLAPEIDARMVLRGRVLTVRGRGIPRITIRINAVEADGPD